MAHDIFICYSSKDLTIATRVRDHLRAAGWQVFMDRHIQAGHRWSQEIEQELAAARAVVVLWSTNAKASRFVMDEAHEAADRNVLYPVRIENVAIPHGFRQFQTPDLLAWDGDIAHDGFKLLLESLRTHLDPAPVASVAPPASSTPQPKPKSPLILPSPGQTFRDTLKSGGEGPLMVVIPSGRFLMGSPASEPKRVENEGPQHTVTFARPFAMGVHAITFDDYDRFASATKRDLPGDRKWGRGTRPAINVSWNDAQDYCAWLKEQTGRPYRLPSEAEWEYACRAGTTTPFHFGERLTTGQANFDGNHTYNGSAKGEYRGKTLPVGSFTANAFGLYDMHGNVWEWCQDRWHDNYDGAPTNGTAWESGDKVARVLRGGSWFNYPTGCRAASRGSFDPGARSYLIGFRLCCASPIE
ncbi:MAG: SUMF1/EgtB/PvdO family nonheme iron enzyme [Thiotrichales bacterium]